MEKTNGLIIGGGLVLIGTLWVIHHLIICGRLFDVSDMLHHEFFEAIFFTAGIVLLLVTLFDRK
ncbi:MAG: hypothetical protein NWF06_02435 [Candidatus Bathyarchaeota archaeon]|nr:hypothetical protein [Candidatus Bathyarchaeum sp.]